MIDTGVLGSLSAGDERAGGVRALRMGRGGDPRMHVRAPVGKGTHCSAQPLEIPSQCAAPLDVYVCKRSELINLINRAKH